ncbi:MAG: hydrogenase maturation nickel metallochaperone HypA [Hespellia sp.]|nr:hydrogenase maturation nickel metallochaperone HypA [Hespellia sp.]
MHELGIIVHISKTLEEIAKENNLTEIGAVTLEVGEVSGIVMEYLVDCWDYFKKEKELLKNSELKAEIIPGVTFCEDCRQTYETVTYGKECPYCKSGHTFLVQGNECNIKEIEAC